MRATLHTGDCLTVLPTLDPESVDAIVTDPPYGLRFMGKDWDHGVPGAHFWTEVLRAAKPGAHLLAFGGPRTHHRLMCAIEDAGWEIRDVLMWLYGSGFPKSHNGPWGGTALKPAWEPIIMARKPLAGTVAANVAAHSTGGLNIDGCRIMAGGESLGGGRVSSRTQGWNRPWKANPDAVAAAHERGAVNVARAERLGRWPANVVLGEDAAATLDAQSGVLTSGGTPARRNADKFRTAYGDFKGLPENPAGIGGSIGGASRFFYTSKASRSERNGGLDEMPTSRVLVGAAGHKTNPMTGRPVVDVPRANHHPTVKPLDLMCWLCRLVTPPGGLILDPFMGSGSTGCAAALEGFGFIGIDTEPEYVEIARHRITHWAAQYQPELFGGVA